MKRAIKAVVEKNFSVYKAAKYFNVNSDTLRRRLIAFHEGRYPDKQNKPLTDAEEETVAYMIVQNAVAGSMITEGSIKKSKFKLIFRLVLFY